MDGEPQGGFSINIMHLLAACRRWAFAVVLFAAVATTGLALAIGYLPPVYKAASVVWLDQREARIISGDSVWSSVGSAPGNPNEQARVVAQTVASVPVLRRVATALDLPNRPDVLRSRLNTAIGNLLADIGLGADPTAASVIDAGRRTAMAPQGERGDEGAPLSPVTALAGAPIYRASMAMEAADPAQGVDVGAGDPIREARIQQAVSGLAAHLEVNVDMRTELVTIAFTALDPVNAAEIANEVPRAFAAEQAARLRSGSESAVTWLEARVEELRRDVIQSEELVNAFRAEHGLIETENNEDARRRLAELNLELDRARSATVTAQNRLEDADEAVRNQTFDAGLFTSTNLDNLRSLSADATGRRADLVAQVGPDHALVRNINQKIEALEVEIRAEKRRLLVELRQDYEATRDLELRLADRIAEEEARLADGLERRSAVTSELRQLEREVLANKTLYQDLLARLKGARQLNELEGSSIRVVQPALVPGGPSGPSPTILLALGGFGALAFGFAGVIGISLLDRRIRHADQLDHLGLTLVAVAPELDRPKELSAPRANGRRDTSFRSRLVFDEAIRRLLSATALATSGPRKAVLVTSGSRGEGKSTISNAFANLAAAGGNRTILVEADLRRPGRYRSEAGDDNGGLAALLEGRQAIGDTLVTDRASGLFVLPTTETVQHSSELLASGRMRSLLAALRNDFDVVVVDSSPMCMTPDAELIAPMVDAAVFVVEHGKTTVGKADLALNNLARAADIPVVAVVNKAEQDFFKEYYGSGEYCYQAVPLHSQGFFGKMGALFRR